MRITESKPKPKMSANERLLAVALIALIAALVFSATGSYFLAGGMAVVAAFSIWLARLFERMTPPDKFHFFQLWKIPDPTTRGTLWLISAFDGALYAVIAVVGSIVAIALADMAGGRAIGVSGSHASTVALAAMAAGTVSRYWRYRRRYEPAAETGGLLLRCAGESPPLTFREKCGLALATVGVIIAWLVGLLVYAAWFIF